MDVATAATAAVAVAATATARRDDENTTAVGEKHHFHNYYGAMEEGILVTATDRLAAAKQIQKNQQGPGLMLFLSSKSSSSDDDDDDDEEHQPLLEEEEEDHVDDADDERIPTVLSPQQLQHDGRRIHPRHYRHHHHRPHFHDDNPEQRHDVKHLRHNLSFESAILSAFSEVRSVNDDEEVEITNESEYYLASNALARAFPERQFALLVTLLFEIPVLFMIAGNSDGLCRLVGRKRYGLLVGFIPLTSAISGNVGLQASTLTTRAISHLHVTEKSYLAWLGREMGAAAFLGMGMGILLSLVALLTSGLDWAFALTIFVAQFISILTAGCSGTFAPLLFSFVFRQDSGKWGGPLETAIQDIVGSFAMTVISYHLLTWLGPRAIGPEDSCFAS